MLLLASVNSLCYAQNPNYSGSTGCALPKSQVPHPNECPAPLLTLPIDFTVSPPSRSEDVLSNAKRPLVSCVVPCPLLYRVSLDSSLCHPSPRLLYCHSVCPGFVYFVDGLLYSAHAQIAEQQRKGAGPGPCSLATTSPSSAEPLIPSILILILHILRRDSQLR